MLLKNTSYTLNGAAYDKQRGQLCHLGFILSMPLTVQLVELEGRLISVSIVTGLFTLFAEATDASLRMRTGD